MSEISDNRLVASQKNTGWLDMTLVMLENIDVVIHASVIQVRGSAPRAVGANILAQLIELMAPKLLDFLYCSSENISLIIF